MLFEKLSRTQFDGSGQFDHRRHLGIAFARLDAADLGGVDAAAFGHLLLGQAKFRSGGLEIGAEVAHVEDRRRSTPKAP
jgi:hypothetical protein